MATGQHTGVLDLIASIAPRMGYRRVSPALIYAQAALETGNFTSAIYRENRNLFGMRRPSQRATMATGTNRDHATYATEVDSIIDYFLRQRYFGVPDTSDPLAYARATQATGYAEAPAYVDAWMSRYRGVLVPAAVGTILAATAITAYAINAQRGPDRI